MMSRTIGVLVLTAIILVFFVGLATSVQQGVDRPRLTVTPAATGTTRPIRTPTPTLPGIEVFATIEFASTEIAAILPVETRVVLATLLPIEDFPAPFPPTPTPGETPPPAAQQSRPVPPPTIEPDPASDPLNQPVVGDIKRLDLVYLGFMIVGIIGKVLYDQIRQSTGIRNSLATLIVALIVSPIVYAAVYEQFIRASLTLEGIGVAFQNGFFWQTVFSEVGKTRQANGSGGGSGTASPSGSVGT